MSSQRIFQTSKLFYAIASLLLFGCTTVIRNPVEDFNLVESGGPQNEKLKSAIARNDAGAVKGLLQSKSFVAKVFSFNRDPDPLDIHKARAYELLSLAITGYSSPGVDDPDSDGVCRTEIVQTILDAGLPPRPVDLARSAEAGCPNVFKSIAIYLNPAENAAGADIFLTSFEKRMRQSEFKSHAFPSKWEAVLSVIKENSGPITNRRIAALNGEFERQAENVQDSQSGAKILEAKFKLKFCSQADLFMAVFTPLSSAVESNCLYVLNGPLKVLQATKGGVLIGPIQMNETIRGVVIFLKTQKQYVDEDPLGPILVRSVGTMKYNTVLGAGKTVHSFQYLSDVNLVRAPNSPDQFQLSPSQ